MGLPSGVEAAGGASSGTDPVLAALAAQSAMFLQAFASLRTGSGTEPELVDSSGSVSMVGTRGSTALEQHGRMLTQHPETVAQAIRENMAGQLATGPSQPQDALEYLRRHCGFRERDDLAHMMVLVATVWNHMELGHDEQAHALAGLTLLAGDQASRDGRWEMAQLMSRAPPTPAEMTYRWPVKDLLRPFSPLASPKWAAAAQAYLREAAGTEEAYKKYGDGRGKGQKKGKEKPTQE